MVWESIRAVEAVLEDRARVFPQELARLRPVGDVARRPPQHAVDDAHGRRRRVRAREGVREVVEGRAPRARLGAAEAPPGPLLRRLRPRSPDRDLLEAVEVLGEDLEHDRAALALGRERVRLRDERGEAAVPEGKLAALLDGGGLGGLLRRRVGRRRRRAAARARRAGRSGRRRVRSARRRRRHRQGLRGSWRPVPVHGKLWRGVETAARPGPARGAPRAGGR
mmetsp:Transcript_15367/g.50119  ORF Transcript_15367/g.50119 Transcript_15367/m.50119 type:complete len:223 (-) Transcript_15367:182-850(-)